MDEYKPNSHKYNDAKKGRDAPEKKIEKVVTRSTKIKKKNEMQKFADVFISEDVENVKSFIILDVLVPTIKKAISEIITNGLDMIFYGETGHAKKSSTASKISYRRFYEKPEDQRPYKPSSSYSRGFDYGTVGFESRGDAETVLEAMCEIIDYYGVISVADFYDLADVSTTNHTANKYGWSDLRDCRVTRVGGEYILKLPRPLPID